MSKPSELKNMSKEDKEKKLKDLRLELLKSKTRNSKTSNKTKQIRRTIAQILTLNK